eukprot:3900966-Rhodomonas_salina.1
MPWSPLQPNSGDIQYKTDLFSSVQITNSITSCSKFPSTNCRLVPATVTQGGMVVDLPDNLQSAFGILGDLVTGYAATKTV